jgi:hypothetical protein
LKIRYLNTDLDVIASRELTPLAIALAARGICHLCEEPRGYDDGGGQWYLTFEVNGSSPDDEPEVTIRTMLDALEAIDGDAKELWTVCSKREFNIGYDCGDEPWAFNQGLETGTRRRISELGASRRVTLYPPADPTRRSELGSGTL